MLQPFDARQWDVFAAAHLLNRAGFGGSPGEIEAFWRLGFAEALRRMVEWQPEPRDFPVPDDRGRPTLFQITADQPLLGIAPAVERIAAPKVDQYQRVSQLRNWWLQRMRTTANPLREKLTLFWHSHFASSVGKVEDAFFLWQQNELLREHALGNFGALLRAISRDPAMMIYLDLRESKRGKPNENFARELLELFTLGIGNYGEADIKAAARAFTGYRVSSVDRIGFELVDRQHDHGLKTFLGREGGWNGDDIIAIVLQQPACAEFISRKLWRFFAGVEPDDATVQGLAATFRASGYELQPLLRELLASERFYGSEVRGHLIKSPVQWVMQTAKSLAVQLPSDGRVANEIREMGQDLFALPNVKGWDGGKAWINTNTLLRRYNFASSLVRGGRWGVESIVDFNRIAPAALRNDRAALVASAGFRLFQRALSAEEFSTYLRYVEQLPRLDDSAVRNLYHVMMSTPQYQLC